MTLRTSLILATAYVLLLALVALGIPLAVSLRDRVDAEVRSQARSQADVVAASAVELVEHDRSASLERLANETAQTVRGRVIAVDTQGRVIADSAGQGYVGADYSARPEIQAALGGASYQQTRQSQTLGQDILATAVPILFRNRTIGAVRVTQSVQAVTDAVRRAILGLAILGVVVLLLGLIAGWLIARAIAKPIGRLEDAARRVSGGDLEARAIVEGSSEQRSLSHSFNEMTDRLSRLLQNQRDFVADASHQLRTPLTGLRLRLEELSEVTADTDPRFHDIEAGLSEVDRLSQIVDELLILSRAGEHELPGEEIGVEGTIETAVRRWQRAARDRGVSLRARAEDDGVIWCAAPDLDRALDALIENAIAYSEPGTEVVVAGFAGRIEVLDRGAGLEPGEEEAVFGRFYRGHAGRHAASGTGLGLAIARELVGQWGGSVSIENRPGGGARATIDLSGAAVRETAGALR